MYKLLLTACVVCFFLFGLFTSSPNNATAKMRAAGSAEKPDTRMNGMVEDLYAASDANLLLDPSFEEYTPNAYWSEYSTSFGTPLCTISDCGSTSIALPRTGDVWGWFGGVALDEEAALEQSVVFPDGAAIIEFYFWIGSAEVGSDAEDIFQVLIDSNIIFSANATEIASFPSYTLIHIDVDEYADGASHLVRFESTTTGQIVNFNLDDVSIYDPDNAQIFLPIALKLFPEAPSATPTVTSTATTTATPTLTLTPVSGVKPRDGVWYWLGTFAGQSQQFYFNVASGGTQMNSVSVNWDQVFWSPSYCVSQIHLSHPGTVTISPTLSFSVSNTGFDCTGQFIGEENSTGSCTMHVSGSVPPGLCFGSYSRTDTFDWVSIWRS